MKNALMLAAALAVASNMASAADFGFYGYGSLGVARIKLDQAGADNAVRTVPGVTQVSSSVDDNPTAFKLQLGYQFDSTWALEGGYTDVQKLNYSGIARAGSTAFGLSANDKLSVWNVVAALSIPLGSSGFQGTGRIGVANVREKMELAVGGISLSSSENKTNLTYGIGVKYNVNQNVSLRADLDHYKASDDDFNVWSVGAGYKF